MPRGDPGRGSADESYLDIDDRSNFDNGGAVTRMYPDFASRVWEAEGCAELVVTGAVLGVVRDRVAMVAGEIPAAGCRGQVRTTTCGIAPNCDPSPSARYCIDIQTQKQNSPASGKPPRVTIPEFWHKTRYDKLARNFLAANNLVAALYWIKL